MPEEIRLWARTSVDGETVLYCPATRELGIYADGYILPLHAGEVSAATLQELRAARPDLAETREGFYLRTERSLGWSRPAIEYFSGVEQVASRRLPDTEVPLEVRRVFNDLRNPRATPDGLEDSDDFSPEEPQSDTGRPGYR